MTVCKIMKTIAFAWKTTYLIYLECNTSSCSSSGSTTVVGQGLPVPLVGLAFSDLWITPPPPPYHSRIVSPTYDGTVYLGFKPMTGMLLSRTIWWLYHKTGCPRVRSKKHIFSFIYLALQAANVGNKIQPSSSLSLLDVATTERNIFTPDEDYPALQP